VAERQQSVENVASIQPPKTPNLSVMTERMSYHARPASSALSTPVAARRKRFGLHGSTVESQGKKSMTNSLMDLNSQDPNRVFV